MNMCGRSLTWQQLQARLGVRHKQTYDLRNLDQTLEGGFSILSESYPYSSLALGPEIHVRKEYFQVLKRELAVGKP
jgi:hypothetical protein